MVNVMEYLSIGNKGADHLWVPKSGTFLWTPCSTRQENQFLPGKGKKLPGAFFLILRPYDSLMQNSSDLGHFEKKKIKMFERFLAALQPYKS